MKILLVNDYATPGYGAENLILALRDGLRKNGNDILLTQITPAFIEMIFISESQPPLLAAVRTKLRRRNLIFMRTY